MERSRRGTAFDGPPAPQRDDRPDERRDAPRKDRSGPGPATDTADGGPVLRCEGLVRRFGDRTAVDGVGFRVEPGETYGLLGPNGAGKTTTIRLVCGLLRPDGGTVRISGRPGGTARTRRLIGYVPQDVALYQDLGVAENLRFFGRLYGLSGRALDRRVDEVLDLVDLRRRAGDRVESLSGGMRRRLNIGAGIVHAPTLLILDEPTVGVDPQSRHAILDSVRRFGSQGMAILYTTHYMEEAERLCDRIGIIDHGRLIAEGTRRELVALVAERDRVRLTASGDLAPYATACRALPRVDSADVGGEQGGVVEVVVREARSLLPSMLDLAHEHGVQVKSVEIVEPDLEAVFLHLTGTALRE
ncbi:ABC transporter ATP-binding protein [Streptomyces sp. NPDC047886]|uniref:ABC transporter ATP-binding protein n=1 Tax=Streptomyces sp. NPDC047886 TaxID=3365490 RepID=UPI00372014C4